MICPRSGHSAAYNSRNSVVFPAPLGRRRSRRLLPEARVESLGDLQFAGVRSGVPADPGHRELSGLVGEVLGHIPTVESGTGPCGTYEASWAAGTSGVTVVDMSTSRQAVESFGRAAW